MSFDEAPMATPIIILGAARSGTKILRAALAVHPALVAIPHDINFVWKYGNYSVTHDELEPRHARPRVKCYVRRYFSRHETGPGVRVVEKTVSNTLRVPYIREVFPGCTFVHIVRDGRDVAESAARMWRADLEWRRVLSKLRGVPLAALPTYGVQYAVTYLRRALSTERAVSSWGPRFAGLDDLARRLPVTEVCAIQWQRCVEAATTALRDVPTADVIEVRYEDLATRPVDVIDAILARLHLAPLEAVRQQVANMVQHVNIGKWRRNLTPEQINAIDARVGATLRALGYGD